MNFFFFSSLTISKIEKQTKLNEVLWVEGIAVSIHFHPSEDRKNRKPKESNDKFSEKKRKKKQTIEKILWKFSVTDESPRCQSLFRSIHSLSVSPKCHEMKRTTEKLNFVFAAAREPI